MRATVPLLLIASVIAISRAAVPTAPTDVQESNDIKALNYALTLEHLEATYYTQGLSNFTLADFAAAGYNATVYSYFGLIHSHELAHVSALNSTIVTLGGTPVPACEYDYGVHNVSEFVATAQVFENVGVMAYDGAVNTIASETLLTVAATIATVEARHAAYLNLLLNFLPFPSAFNNATVPVGIVGLISPFIVACPYALDESALPVPLVELPVATISPNGATSPPAVSTTTTDANDIKALNYALTLEHLEATYYTQGLNNFTLADFAAAGYNATVYTYFGLIHSHELAHVSTLNSTIIMLGGTPVPACVYNFNVSNVQEFVATAQVFENVGVMAYDGAVDTIANEIYLTLAATIVAVEARHAAYLNLLVGQVPFPSAFDNATAPIDIVALVSPYIQSCPYTIDNSTLPMPLSSLPQANATTTTSTIPTSATTTTMSTTTLPNYTSLASPLGAGVILLCLLSLSVGVSF